MSKNVVAGFAKHSHSDQSSRLPVGLA